MIILPTLPSSISFRFPLNLFFLPSLPVTIPLENIPPAQKPLRTLRSSAEVGPRVVQPRAGIHSRRVLLVSAAM